MRRIRFIILALLVLCLAFALTACFGVGEVTKATTAKTATPPVYEGISLRGDANLSRQGQAARLLSSADPTEDASGPAVVGDCVEEVAAFDPDADPFATGTAPLEEKAADALEVVGAASDIYYAEKNQDLYVVVRLSNPDNYEIQSFTLNGVKYANYMFEKGSDMENLILKVNVGDAAGIIEYTLDTVKYIDGTEIKDVKLDGEKTVRAGVQTDGQLTVAVGEPTATLRTVSFSVSIDDKYGLIANADGYAKAILYDGETVYEKDLSLGDNAVVFENLTPNSAYQYAVAAYYDDLGGDGAALHTYAKKAVRTNAEILFKDVTVSQSSVEWDYYLDDECPDLTVSGLELYLDGVKVSEPDAAAKIADGLLSNRSYTVVAQYVSVDGQDETISFTAKTVSKQTPTLAIGDVAATQTAVNFAVSFSDSDQVGAISKIELVHGDDATEAADLTARAFDDLLSNNDYAIRITCTYDANDGAGERTLVVTREFKTAAKHAPVVSVTNLTSSRTEIDGSLNVSDPDGICTVDEVALYKGDEKVGTVDERDRLVFSGLQSGATYRIVVSFSYDLNDGKGAHDETFAVAYPTLVESIAVEEMILLNNNVVKHGEELNLRVYFINPSEIEITAIYVNGQRVTVVGGDRVESAIIKFVPEEIGLIDFSVDQVDYTYLDFPISQEIDTDVSVQYPIFGDLEIEYTPVTSLPYENSGDGVYLSFDNAYDYTVYAINGSADFVRFADGQYFTSASRVSSIEYGYEHYGHTTQTCAYRTPGVVSVGKNYQSVSTAEEFLSMTDGYYYLTADLDLRNVTLSQPINFRGVLIGNGHKIRGLHNVIDTSKTKYYDIIGSTGSFYDVSFTELYISVNATSDSRVTIQPLGGARLVNCSVRGDIIGNQYVTVSDLSGVRNSSSFNVNIALDGNTSTLKYTAGSTLVKNAAVTIDENGAATYTLPNGKVYFFGTFRTDLTTFTPAPEVFAIGNGALKNCTQLTEVTIPETVWCGYNVLGECPLVRATLPVRIVNDLPDSTKSNLEELVVCGSGSIGSRAFLTCPRLTSVTIGNGVTSIGEHAFYGCTGLTSIAISDSVTSIGDSAFYYCSGLTEITIPDSVTSIEDLAFAECTGLTAVTIGNSVTSIGRYAFYYCSELTSVTIGNGVKSIGDNAFSRCFRLTSVTFRNPSGWYVTETNGASEGTAVKVSDPSASAQYLKSTYMTYYWYVCENHVWSEEYTLDVAPTCTTVGSKSIRCMVCDMKQPDSEVEIPIDPDAHVVENWIVDQAATLLADGIRHGECTICHTNVVSEYIVCKSSATEYKFTTDSTDILDKSKNFGSEILTDGKHFYPTEANPNGLDLHIEFSFLWNDTLQKMSSIGDTKAQILTGQIGNQDAYWMALTTNAKGCDNKVAPGGFEYVACRTVEYGPAGMSQQTATGGKVGNTYADFPNIGGSDQANPEWGWHRVAFVVHEELLNADALKADTYANATAAKYLITFTCYVDGVKLYTLSNRSDAAFKASTYRAENMLFTAASDGAGGIVYADISADKNVNWISIPTYQTTEGVAYAVYADEAIFAGNDFAQNVVKVTDPEENVYTTADGTEIPAKIWYRLAD